MKKGARVPNSNYSNNDERHAYVTLLDQLLLLLLLLFCYSAILLFCYSTFLYIFLGVFRSSLHLLFSCSLSHCIWCSATLTLHHRYQQHYDAMHAAVMSEGPWAYYTDVESQYEVEDEGKGAVWRDMSGNERHSVRITTNKDAKLVPKPFKQHPAPYKQDTAPETASVICNDEQGLLFPNGSLPSGKYTIIARAKYIKAEGKFWSQCMWCVPISTALRLRCRTARLRSSELRNRIMNAYIRVRGCGSLVCRCAFSGCIFIAAPGHVGFDLLGFWVI